MGLISWAEVKLLFHPHYIINIFLALSLLLIRTVYPACYYFFPNDNCELDFRETEILTFLLIIIFFRTRKAGVTSVVPYLSHACMYAKVANLMLYFRLDPRMAVIYGIICLLMLVLLPEPSKQLESNIVYFDSKTLEEELQRDLRVIWVIEFFAIWSDLCVSFATAYSELSTRYSLDNLRFGKVDVTRHPDIAQKYQINASARSKQLPTVALFKNGKQVIRRPMVDANSKLVPFTFTKDNVIQAFDLNNVYEEQKRNPLSKKAKSE